MMSTHSCPAGWLVGARHRLSSLVLAAFLGACTGPEGTMGSSAEAPGSIDAPATEDVPPATDSVEQFEPQAAATAPQRILFSSTRKGYYDLFKMDPQGYNVARVTSFASYETEPAWSWNNKRIAMVRPRRDASNVEHSDIYLMNADGTNKRWARSLPSSFDIRHPSWSPDGSRLVVSVRIGGASYLATLKLSTGAMAFVKADGQIVQGREPSYDATGEAIIFVGRTGKTVDQVWNGFRYGLVAPGKSVGSPSFSPDGKKIAFSMVTDGNVDIFVQTRATMSTKRLTTHAGYDGQPTWSPDGSRIAFASSRSGKSQIWTMSAATGGSLARITHTATDEKDPAWSH